MQSMEEIYRQHAQTVYRYLLAQTRSADLAEELTQETFYQAVRTAGQYRGEGKLTTWLCGIAKNVLRTYQRRHPQEEELDETAAAPDTPDEAFLARESQLELLRKMQTLGSDVPADLRCALVPRHWRNSLPHRELGACHVLPRQGSTAKGAGKRR